MNAPHGSLAPLVRFVARRLLYRDRLRGALEEELSLKRQFLDVLILRWGDGPEPESLPDGLEGLGEHNLVTYKSSAESLDSWALDELFGHYVNYRKQLREQNVDALESAFRFYAVSPTTRAACSNR